MSDWQHTLANWVVGGVALVMFHVISALLSTLVWHLRNRLDLEHLKSLLAFAVLLPAASVGVILLSPSVALCAGQATCYLDWMVRHFGSDATQVLRLSVPLFAGAMLLWLSGMVYRASVALQTVRQLREHSQPASDKLRRVLQGLIPPPWHARFREVPMPSQADGVYAGWCFLSSDTITSLAEEQLRVVVAHEYEHLRAHDGWLTLIMGIVAGNGLWGGAHRRWIDAAELLADRRATRWAVARTDLARLLLQRQAQAQGVMLGFGSGDALLEERLRCLLSPRRRLNAVHPSCLWCGAAVGAGCLAYVLQSIAGASTCTVHCLFFH